MAPPRSLRAAAWVIPVALFVGSAGLWQWSALRLSGQTVTTGYCCLKNSAQCTGGVSEDDCVDNPIFHIFDYAQGACEGICGKQPSTYFCTNRTAVMAGADAMCLSPSQNPNSANEIVYMGETNCETACESYTCDKCDGCNGQANCNKVVCEGNQTCRWEPIGSQCKQNPAKGCSAGSSSAGSVSSGTSSHGSSAVSSGTSSHASSATSSVSSGSKFCCFPNLTPKCSLMPLSCGASPYQPFNSLSTCDAACSGTLSSSSETSSYASSKASSGASSNASSGASSKASSGASSAGSSGGSSGASSTASSGASSKASSHASSGASSKASSGASSAASSGASSKTSSEASSSAPIPPYVACCNRATGEVDFGYVGGTIDTSDPAHNYLQSELDIDYDIIETYPVVKACSALADPTQSKVILTFWNSIPSEPDVKKFAKLCTQAESAMSGGGSGGSGGGGGGSGGNGFYACPYQISAQKTCSAFNPVTDSMQGKMILSAKNSLQQCTAMCQKVLQQSGTGDCCMPSGCVTGQTVQQCNAGGVSHPWMPSKDPSDDPSTPSTCQTVYTIDPDLCK